MPSSICRYLMSSHSILLAGPSVEAITHGGGSPSKNIANSATLNFVNQNNEHAAQSRL